MTVPQIAVSVALIIGLTAARNEEAQLTQEVKQESALEKFESRLNEAKNLAERGHYEAAKNITMALLKENPENREVAQLQTRIDNELAFEESI